MVFCIHQRGPQSRDAASLAQTCLESYRRFGPCGVSINATLVSKQEGVREPLMYNFKVPMHPAVGWFVPDFSDSGREGEIEFV